MNNFEFGSFVSFTLAIILLFIGKGLIGKIEILRRYGIPEPVIGGFLCAACVGVVYYFFDLKISFTLEVRDWLLLYFFAAIGLQADVRTPFQVANRSPSCWCLLRFSYCCRTSSAWV